jgi:hypothetical protein
MTFLFINAFVKLGIKKGGEERREANRRKEKGSSNLMEVLGILMFLILSQ